jgi:putative addiction module component (TIGR02574 family)
MTKLFDMAVEAVSQLSPEEQDEIAKTIFDFVDAHAEPYVLSDSETEMIKERLKQADRGEFATEEEVEAVFSKYRRSRFGSW